MKSGQFRLYEDARTYYFPESTLRIEGGVDLFRDIRSICGMVAVFDVIIDKAGIAYNIPSGWKGVSQEGDSPVSQDEVILEVDNGPVQEN